MSTLSVKRKTVTSQLYGNCFQKCLFLEFIDTFLFFNVPLISRWKSVLNILNKRFLKKNLRSERGSRLEQHFSKSEIYKGKKLLFHIVFEKGPFTGIRKRFRENIISIKIVGNAILGGVFLETFFLKRFLQPVLAFQKNFL